MSRLEIPFLVGGNNGVTPTSRNVKYNSTCDERWKNGISPLWGGCVETVPKILPIEFFSFMTSNLSYVEKVLPRESQTRILGQNVRTNLRIVEIHTILLYVECSRKLSNEKTASDISWHLHHRQIFLGRVSLTVFSQKYKIIATENKNWCKNKQNKDSIL